MDLLKRHSENKPGKHVKTSNSNNNENIPKDSHISDKFESSHKNNER
ncbi:MAG: hypothetical protein AB9836_02165 [Aminipila sp.]